MARAQPLICHITTRSAWEAAAQAGPDKTAQPPVYRTPSLDADGFIHCSTPQQAADTGRRFFGGQTGLVLLWIDPALLTAELRIESASDGSGNFPHVYGPINLNAVVKVTDFDPDQD
jgi:uncharacterized protein (DUF952 family)